MSAVYKPGSSALAGPLKLNVALLGFNIVTAVERGENGGRKLEHDFIVLGFASTPLASGTDRRYTSDLIHLDTRGKMPPGAVVAWVSSSKGAILQITGGWLPPEYRPATN